MGNRRKILIIDDEQDLCRLLQLYFFRRGYLVEITHTLGDGVKAMKNFLPDILFLDNNLPDGTGWAQVAYFMQINPDLKLYLMSGFQPEAPHIEGVQYTLLTKPISFSDLDHQL
ncbi:response regulator [Pseudoflavitalea sp. G-6-1-2]|uniref:response regulator n=1 Tax=Pseudoflavitalea sp. G-6-1-2 TaxID=2728841 RepID=UPI00146D30B6|nr:response regulator [Pseudoflavitalea sp. G-6-1-2]NML22492.1 response regulator [Pseudoflavitalea sp. G-6-1-2]